MNDKINEFGFLIESYESGESCLTLVFGDGSVGVHHVEYNDGLACLGFSDGWNGDVGRDMVVCSDMKGGELSTELGTKFIMKFTRPESIDVVIHMLNELKKEKFPESISEQVSLDSIFINC